MLEELLQIASPNSANSGLMSIKLGRNQAGQYTSSSPSKTCFRPIWECVCKGNSGWSKLVGHVRDVHGGLRTATHEHASTTFSLRDLVVLGCINHSQTSKTAPCDETSLTKSPPAMPGRERARVQWNKGA